MMMRNFYLLIIIVYLNAQGSLNVSQKRQLETNESASERLYVGPKNTSTLCNPWNTLYSIVRNMETKNHRKCNKLRFSLFPLVEGSIFLATYHNAIDAVIRLITYWKMENAAFIIDSETGIDFTDVRAYLKMHFNSIAFETFFLDSKLAILENLLAISEKFNNFAIICNQQKTNAIINVINNKNLFNTSHRWIFVSETFPKELHETIISVESQVTLISPKASSEISLDLRSSPELFIYDVFYSYQSRQTEVIKFAQWTTKNGLFILENLESKDWSKRLRGRQIKLGAFKHLPYINFTPVNGTMTFYGLKVEILVMLMEYFNANYSMTAYPLVWGIYTNGTYTGLLGVVYRKEIDVPINGFAQTDFRLKASRFLYPLTKFDLSMSYTTPESVVSPTTHVFPFSGEVWLCIVIVLLCILMALAIAMVFSPGWKSAQTSSLSSHTNTFRLVTGSFFKEVLTDPPGITAKVIYGTLLIATLSVFIFYTSVFTSFLAYRELKMPIRNLDDLVKSQEYSAIIIKNSVYEDMFRFAKDGIFKDLWKKLEKTFTESLQTAIGAVRNMYKDKAVLLTDSASTIAAINNNCSISLIKTPFLRNHFYMITRNDFPYSRMLYMRLLHITEGGIFDRLGKKYMTLSRPPCDDPEPNLTLGLLQVAGLFVLLLCGMTLALVILLVEKTLKFRK